MGQLFHDPCFEAVADDGSRIAVDLHVYYRDDNRTVVVISHRDDEPPQCSVRCVEAITNRLASELGYDFDYVIEHFPARQSRTDPETFDLIPLQCERTSGHYAVARAGREWRWSHLERRTAEAIAGEPI